MSNFILDNMGGTVGATLSSRLPVVGSAYTNTGGGDPLIASDGAEANVDAQGICWNTTTPPSADYTVEATLKHKDFQSDQNWHIIGRGNVSSGDRYALVLNAFIVPPALHLSRFDGSGETQIGVLNFTPNVGQSYTFQLVFAGSLIKAYRDGSLILSGTDSAITAAGKTGVVLQGAVTGSTGIRVTQFRAFVPDAAPTLNSAVVPSTAEKINTVFSASITPSASDFLVQAGGVGFPILSVSGSGTDWAINLPRKTWIPASSVVKVSYVGSVATQATVTATNNSVVNTPTQLMEDKAFGAFIHFSAATWALIDPLDSASIAQITPTQLNVDQWLDDVVIPSGCRYAVFTTKHSGSWCWWPTASGSPHYSVDVVKLYTDACRARGLGVGLYINTYDPAWVAAHGSYGTPSAFTAHMVTEITELLTNYGQIDYLWIDSAAYWPTYTNFIWSTVHAAIVALQPNCVVTSNDGAYYTPITDHSQVAQYEILGIGLPPSNNAYPADTCTPSRVDEAWAWQASGQDVYKSPLYIAQVLSYCRQVNCMFTLNFCPDTRGLMPDSTVTYAAALGAVIGRQGGALLPIPGEVAKGVDRGDGTFGSRLQGINGSGILGMI